jgi:formylglycine-generating enzyme required for sulfatase activity
MAAADAHVSDPGEGTKLRGIPGETDPGLTVPPEEGPTITPELTHLRAGGRSGSAREPIQSAVGRILGNRYRLEQVLGAGGMGIVYKAADLQVPGEFFAIKVLNEALQGHPQLVAALREEVRKTRVLSHPNIVGAYTVNSDGDGDYMLMEYLEGKTLQRLLDDEFGRGIPFARAWPLITDICAALAYAHDHNVIHSDLKPSNVFVTTGGKAKLLDFGIARVARGPIRGFDAGAFGAMTESYASCEMLEGGEPDVRDDVYALGCVVYEMLSGKPPFSRRSAIEARALGFTAPPLATLSRRQNAALARALSFDREQRTASVEAFLAQMQPASPVSRRWLSIAGGVLVAALVIGGIVVFGPNSSHPGAPAAAAFPNVSDASLAPARLMAQKAAALGVDAKEGLLKAGLRQLSAAQEALRQGSSSKAASFIGQAEGSLREAIRSSPRATLVGSTPEEIESAAQLCRKETGNNPDCIPASFADERARKVSLPPFGLDQLPATNAEFAEFVAKTGYATAAEKQHGLYAAAEKATLLPNWSWRTLEEKELPSVGDPVDYPVRGIDYESARAYCAWRGKLLPTEDEWEFAARGPGRQVYPWGNNATDAPDPATRKLLTAGSAPPTGAFGNRGLGGQVWEWADGTDGKPILRGPSYLVNLTFYQRLAVRERENPGHARVDTGVRCANSFEAWPDSVTTGAAQ